MAAPGAERKLRSDRVCPQADNATSPRGLCFSRRSLSSGPGVLPALSLIPTDEDRFRDRILARVFPTSIEQSEIPFGDDLLGGRMRGFDRAFLRSLATGASAGKVVLGEVLSGDRSIRPSPG